MNENDFSRSFSLYWPEHIGNMKEFKEISKAADIEIKRLWEALKSVLDNRYLTSMDADECAELETMLGIVPLPDDTLEDRVRRVKGYFVSNLPYTQNKLIEVRGRELCFAGGAWTVYGTCWCKTGIGAAHRQCCGNS